MTLLQKALFGMVFAASFALVPNVMQAEEMDNNDAQVGETSQDENSLAWRRWGFYGPGFYRPVGGYYNAHPYWYHRYGYRVYWR